MGENDQRATRKASVVKDKSLIHAVEEKQR